MTVGAVQSIIYNLGYHRVAAQQQEIHRLVQQWDSCLTVDNDFLLNIPRI